jgi:hypothetical protein
MTEHAPLPVQGYTAQSDEKVALVNHNKQLEEAVLRQFDFLASLPELDKRMVALARTKLQESFMWVNRAVFQPGRVKLPGDE